MLPIVNLFGTARIKYDGGRWGPSGPGPVQEGHPMPLYEYECQHCGQVFEVFTQRRETAAQPKCPACGKAGAERVLSSFSGKIGEGGVCGTVSGLG